MSYYGRETVSKTRTTEPEDSCPQMCVAAWGSLIAVFCGSSVVDFFKYTLTWISITVLLSYN